MVRFVPFAVALVVLVALMWWQSPTSEQPRVTKSADLSDSGESFGGLLLPEGVTPAAPVDLCLVSADGDVWRAVTLCRDQSPNDPNGSCAVSRDGELWIHYPICRGIRHKSSH